MCFVALSRFPITALKLKPRENPYQRWLPGGAANFLNRIRQFLNETVRSDRDLSGQTQKGSARSSPRRREFSSTSGQCNLFNMSPKYENGEVRFATNRTLGTRDLYPRRIVSTKLSATVRSLVASEVNRSAELSMPLAALLVC